MKKAQFVSALFLDVNNDYTYAQIAALVSEEFKEKFSIHALKDLIKTREFDEAYNGLLPDVTTDPRYRAARSTASDMLMKAMRELENLMSNPNTPAGVRLRAVEKVLDLNGMTAPREPEGDAGELSRFLAARGMQFSQTNNILVLPPEYQDAMKLVAATQQDVVDAEATEVDSEAPPTA